MTLTSKQRAHLRALAHPLQPVVQIGKAGLTEAVTTQIDAALETHELIKVKLGRECPVDVRDAQQPVEAATRSQVVQTVGRTLVVYRRRDKKPKIVLPKSAPLS